MTSQAVVQVENLSRFYQNQSAIKNLSFSLNAGEVLGFLGPNGAGKSTTMKILTGNLAPSEGQVRIKGFDIIESPREAKQQIGYLPEHPPLYCEASVDEYLKYCAQLRGIRRQSINKALDVSKQQCGLSDVGRRLIGHLSKGYQQRVGIAQAIIHNPPVIILDEPTVGLDPIQMRDIRHLIKKLGQEHSVILSTHILSEVQATCDQVQIIQQGELIYHSSIETLNLSQAPSMTIGLNQPPTIEQLKQLDQVTHVKAIDEQRFELFFEGESPAQAIVQQSVQQQWELYELIPGQQSLEDLFIELTQDETSVDPEVTNK
jgi:ABC-2 type transport system ATP-binding protein|tara:strand:+ start:61631 stop:62581 length:951 start_codon:yes stop_codon:yes gene_type:complete